MRVRLAAPDDLNALVEVKTDAIRPIYEPIGSEELREDYDPAHQRAWLGHLLATMGQNDAFLVAVDDSDRAAGWIRLLCGSGVDAGTGEIRGLFVSPFHQGQGVGRTLVLEGCCVLIQRGCLRARVQTLAASPACGFYERLGARYVGDVPSRAQLYESVYVWDDISAELDVPPERSSKVSNRNAAHVDATPNVRRVSALSEELVVHLPRSVARRRCRD